MLLSVAATTGQLFISYTIKTLGSLVFATIMTTRQFLSILLSCVLFAHPLSGGQWAGTIVVFSALYYQTLSKSGGKGGHHGKGSSSSGGGEGGKSNGGSGGDEESIPLMKAGSGPDLGPGGGGSSAK